MKDEEIYEIYLSSHATIKDLALELGLSLDRVRAVLRLYSDNPPTSLLELHQLQKHLYSYRA